MEEETRKRGGKRGEGRGGKEEGTEKMHDVGGKGEGELEGEGRHTIPRP